MEVVPPRAEIYPLWCFLEGRVPPRPFGAEFCKSLWILDIEKSKSTKWGCAPFFSAAPSLTRPPGTGKLPQHAKDSVSPSRSSPSADPPPNTPPAASPHPAARLQWTVCLLYFALALVAQSLFKTIAVWPSAGVALAAFLVFGYRIWPAIAGGTALGVAAYFAEIGQSPVAPIPLVVNALTVFGNVAAAAVARRLVGDVRNMDDTFGNQFWILQKFIPACLGFGLASALPGVGAYWLVGQPWKIGFLAGAAGWVVSDVVGAIIIGPLFACLWLEGVGSCPRRQIPNNLLAFLVSIFLAIHAFWGTDWAMSRIFFQPSLLLLPLIFIAITCSSFFALFYSAFTFFLVWAGTQFGTSPFGEPGAASTLAAMQTFVGFSSAVVLLIHSLVRRQRMDRNRQVDTQRQINLHLENMVSERTQHLRESERKYRMLAETMKDVVWTLDVDSLRFLYVSPSVEQLRGFSVDEVMAESLDASVSPEFRDLVLGTLRQGIAAFREGKLATTDFLRGDFQQPCKDGSSVWVEVISHLWRDPDSGKIILHGVTRDASERKKTELELHSALVNLQRSQAIAHVGNWTLDLASQSFSASAECLRIAGLPPTASPTYADILNQIHPDDRNAARNAMQRALETGAPFQVEMRIVRKDNGETRTIVSIGEIERNPDGKPARVFGTNQDVTERKRSLDAQRDSEERHRLLFAHSIAAIATHEIVRDALGKPVDYLYLTVNPAFERMTGLQADSVARKSALELFPETDPALIAAYGAVAATGNPATFEHYSPELDKYFQVSAFRTAPDQFACIFDDVTERRRAAQQLQATNATLEAAIERANEMAIRAEAASIAKSEFIANVSHEIRTPMNAIIGFADLLAAGIQDPRQRHQASVIAGSGKSLLRLINDILDLSKIEAGRLDIKTEKTSPARLLEEIHHLFAPRAREKNVSLSFGTDPRLPHVALLDVVRLRQILVNLVGNAIKFTDSGSVSVLAERIPPSPNTPQPTTNDQQPSSVCLRFSVSDTGIGISDEFMSRLFGAFEQATGQDHAKYGGTGLGLAISQRLARLMNGEISVSPNPAGRGSVFSLVLRDVPIFDASPEAPSAEAHIRHVVFRETPPVLVADPAEANRELLKSYLAPYGFPVVEAADGRQAIERVRTHRPRIALTEIKMPKTEGLELVQGLRAAHAEVSGPDAPPLFLVAVTASAMGAKTDVDEADFDEFLAKPVSQADLLRAIARFVPHDLPAPNHPAPSPKHPPSFQLPAHLLADVSAARKNLRVSQVKELANSLRPLPPLAPVAEALHAAADSFQIDRIQAILDQLLPPEAKP